MTTAATTRVEVFADIVCPFTHVGLRRFVEARAVRPSEVRLRVRAWPLEGVNGRPLSPETAAQEIDALRELVAPELFASFDHSSFPKTSLPAFGLVAAAYLLDDPTGEAVSLAVRDALFERGLDVTDPEVLHAIGEPYGVVPMSKSEAGAATRADWARGKVKGVQGSPHFFVGEADWFCPSLVIRHEGDGFDIKIAPDTMQEFYAATLG
jgi:predicted DsbA family dithiol-disulfide isomerase